MPMPHSGPRFYIWAPSKDGELKDLLKKGDKWSVGGDSVNSYITLSEAVMDDFGWLLLEHGPGSGSSNRTVRFHQYDDGTNNVRITCTGWGSTVVELYDGDAQTVIDYFMAHQKRAGAQ